ncbi:DnaB helicase C-terminal domain-containing protein, partial [Cronobacter sakazakii]|uniref:DnaB helicase C-terminal domain-containing protein n=1 Tax=Cronobacter sakazakii TaxID=28141 RepID=UPI001EFC5D45
MLDNDEIARMRIIVDTEPKLTVDMIRARALKQAQSPQGLDFVVVDYLQLITPVGRFSSRQEAVADISRNMKLLAKQLE